MIPTEFPVFVKADILRTPSDTFDAGKQKTTIGWLQWLYLTNDDHYIIFPEDQQDYENAVKDFKRANGIALSKDLLVWEETHTQMQQCRALNNFRKFLGYTEIQ